MAATAWAVAAPTIEEILFENDTVSLCLLLNRRTRTLRVFDFRAGASPAKRDFIVTVAKRERVERIFTIVEHEEVKTWKRFGFVREGTIPAFFRRSDALILGNVIDYDSESRGVASDRSGHRCMHPDPAPSGQLIPVDAVESIIGSAKHVARTAPGREDKPHVRLVEATASDVKKALDTAVRVGAVLTHFDPFGRGSERRYYFGMCRTSQVVLLSVEIQPCFGHVLLEFLSPPCSDRDATLFYAATELLLDRLVPLNVATVFATSPVDDARLAAVFLMCGFRRTGVLGRHSWVRNVRRDAVLWAKKTPMVP